MIQAELSLRALLLVALSPEGTQLYESAPAGTGRLMRRHTHGSLTLCHIRARPTRERGSWHLTV